MTSPAGEHAAYDELAAGYALHALDPDEELRFRRHVPGCVRCQEALSDFVNVTAALADSWPALEPDWPAGEPSPELGERIMAAAAGPPPGMDDLATRRHRRQHRHRGRAVIAGAAAAALIAGGSIWGALPGSGSGPARPAAGCVRAGTCREVLLTGTRSWAPAARVIVTGQTVWLMPSGLPADDTARQVYVLWQITGAHTPLAVGSFDVRGHGDKPMRIGSLAVPFRGTWAFAVSLEHGRTIPATPSPPVALGQVLS